MKNFSFARWWAIVVKEFLQLKRDRVTFAMMVGIPIMQLALFGFAINSDPKRLPTAVISADNGEFARSFTAAMSVSEYFKLKTEYQNEIEAREALKRGEVQFVLTIEPDFTKKVLRGEKPSILLEADATDPMSVSIALSSLSSIASSVYEKDLKGALGQQKSEEPFGVIVHRLYNPEGITQYNIVPGLMGVILTMTLTMMTALAITREREKGTMENLLATPAKPLEILTGKIVPYVLIGLIQASIILIASKYIFNVPFEGSVVTVYGVALIFIAVNLSIGVTISSIAKNMLQALQLTFFYFLPSMLLSGFMFPFLGMPKWAQTIGEILPLTHFNRLIRGIFLKGSDFSTLWVDIWPLLAVNVVTIWVAVRLYKRTLD